MKAYLSKMRGGSVCPPRPSHGHIFCTFLGTFLATGAVASIAWLSNTQLIMAPFGATCALAFGVPDSPLAQPRNIVGGHVLSTLVGLVFLHTMGVSGLSMALAVAVAIAAMLLTSTLHPPAGADPLVVMTIGASWGFLVTPVAAGSLLLVVCALTFNNLVTERAYPKYWL